MIKPTIGRRVWFWPSSSYVDRNRSVTMLRGDQPFDAGIVYVHHDRMVNLLVTDHVGHVFVVRSVPLLQAGDPSDGKSYDFYCEWMPYQKGQAAKAEGLSGTLQPAQRDALDTLLHVRVPILDQIYDLCQAIEKCGASPELTDAVTKASALREPISELVRQALLLGVGDGIVSVNVSPEPSPAAGDVTVTSRDVSGDAIEQEIQAKGLTAPRITPADIEAAVVSEHYFTAHQGDAKAVEEAAFSGGSLDAAASRPTPDALRLLTFCVLVLRNGFTVTGESACASPENFDAEVGRKIARQNALREVGKLEGYLLRERLHNAAAVAGAVALLETTADCCDTNAAARYDSRQVEQDLANAASYRLAASLLQA